MCRKGMIFAAFVLILCLLAGCGVIAVQDAPVSEEPNAEYAASDEYVVYVEFDESFAIDDIQVAMTPAADKKAGSEIPLPYYEDLRGCVTTLPEGAYCIQVKFSEDGSVKTTERYFVVDAEHSYYHLVFSSKLYA